MRTVPGDGEVPVDWLAWERAYARGEFRKQPVHPKMVALATRFKSLGTKRVLDLGCGSGQYMVFLAEMGFEVVGLDVAPTGLGITLQKLTEAGLIGYVVLSDIQQLPFDAALFDAIISVRVIHHNRLELIQQTIAEIWRVLRPGGLVWVTVPVPQEHPSKRGVEIEPGTFVPLEGCEKGLPHHLFTEDELTQLFQRFSVLELHVYEYSHYSLLAEKSRE